MSKRKNPPPPPPITKEGKEWQKYCDLILEEYEQYVKVHGFGLIDIFYLFCFLYFFFDWIAPNIISPFYEIIFLSIYDFFN